MPSFKVEPFRPKGSPERKLADPSHTKPIQIHKENPKNLHGIFVGLEGALGLRFGCDKDEWEYPVTSYETEMADLMIDAYRKKAQTVGELYVVVDELTIASARAIFTLPINIPGHRKKAVVGTFDYHPVEREDEGATALLLGRNPLGAIKTDTENPYFKPNQSPTDPTQIQTPTHATYRIAGTIGTV